MTATRKRPGTPPLPSGGQDATLQLTLHGNTITVHGLLVAETVEMVLGAIHYLGICGWSDVIVDVAGIHAVDATAAAVLAAAQTRPVQAGTRLRIRAPYASTLSMFPQCELELPARPNPTSSAEAVGAAVWRS